MDQHIGLDVSLKDTSISVRENGKRVWRGKCASDPKLLADLIRKRAPRVKQVVFETGPLAVWFYHALTAEGLPAICIDARHAKAALDMAANKTDANDADGRVASFRNVPERSVVASRQMLPTAPRAYWPFPADGLSCSRAVGEAERQPVRRHPLWSPRLQGHCWVMQS